MPPKRKAPTRATTRSAKKLDVEENDKSINDTEVEHTPEPEKQLSKSQRQRAKKKAVSANNSKVDITLQPESIQTEPQPKPDIDNKSITPQQTPKKKSVTPELKKKDTSLKVTKHSVQAEKQQSIPSRISSPVKKQLNSAEQFNPQRIEKVIGEAFLQKNAGKLNTIIDDLRGNKSDQIFNDFKLSTESRFKASDDLINSLTSKNSKLLDEIELLKQRLKDVENQSIVSSVKQSGNEDANFQNELILDMIEQIVGLRIHRAEETDEALSFDCSQSGKNGFLDYKLTISKTDPSEIIYTPVNDPTETEELKDILPDYFFDNLTFPLDTLQQFYHKIYRGLNK